ncbi:hypothetical protein [Pyrobaculum calidifontis]|uniref:EVE domain-containing protein n=1 Tax=Pyrobaculum calidifontis (strain DSM 21063 / JCM 11548 / VA1) TaxID=410359 RepID=A3MU24_PYRCJ|nr:hypothetical protein [Pyrobaculum calidifontis]ABO08141.1 hypothetical protein Pcal_0715 [Pyrobaculum calidifontis JCM 11548]
MYLLFKGRLANFSHSLLDYLERRSALIRRFLPGVFLWGASRRNSLLQEGAHVFLYVAKEVGFPGGVVLYGVLQKPEELLEKYWPEGEWPILLPIKVERLAPGVAESPLDPSRWRPVTLAQLQQIGVRVLPSPAQPLPEEKAKALLSLLR